MRARLIYTPLLIFLGLTGLLSSCDMEQEILVKLPPTVPQMVVECYLTNNEPMQLSLSESSSYFAGPEALIVTGATVTIAKNNEEPVVLKDTLILDEENEKVFTHYNRRRVRAVPGDVFKLVITDPKGRRITGSTTVLPAVPIDSAGYKFNDKPAESQEAYLMVRWQDDKAVKNFYRLLAHKKDSVGVDSQLDAEIDDRLRNGQKITYTTTYRFDRNDTLTIKLFHLEKAYSDFVSSVEDARRANGNPFAQPVTIKSTVAGGFGVFTFLNFTSKELIIK
ncbi:DUF4249 domain-containing protein [Rufibacter tibetensis]|uniref:DUF4249 domain-containing protein n=1 Tax=Rufibacter tibetensis TaxID=512763 RepID=A0A0P0C919_9BACT|nr:DUF4249 domain-containing protein [Rufibacter tibetensis]ALI97889.1 hypothetical protein DC20_01475 [Rufibacter tibetensis]